MAKRKKPRKQKHIPQRTCVVCREKFDKRRLTRLVRTPEGDVVVDPTGKRNGRGAYLCDQPICWERALDNLRILNRALLTEISASEALAIAAHQPQGIDGGDGQERE